VGEFRALPSETVTVDIHCVTRWSKLDTTWEGVSINTLLAQVDADDFAALLALLDPDVVLRADPAAVRAGATREVRGAAAVADTFSGRARFAQPALVNGAVGAVWAPTLPDAPRFGRRRTPSPPRRARTPRQAGVRSAGRTFRSGRHRDR
jgi:hypothetical protein